MCSCSCSTSGIWEGLIRCVSFDLNTENLKKEVINSICMCKTPLYQWSRPSLCFYHSYIVIKTNNCYWSVEKNDVSIVIQKSSEKDIVLKKIYGGPRKPETIDKELSVGFITFQELVDWIKENELKNAYCCSDWYRNCQGFAEKAYNFIKENYDQKMKDFAKYGIGELKKLDENYESVEIDDETETNKFLEYNEMKSEINFSAKINHFFLYKTTLAENNGCGTEEFMIFLTNDGIYSIKMCQDEIFWEKLNNFTDRVKPNDHLIKDCALENVTIDDVNKHIEKCKKPYSGFQKINHFQFLLKSLFDFCSKEIKKTKKNN